MGGAPLVEFSQVLCKFILFILKMHFITHKVFINLIKLQYLLIFYIYFVFNTDSTPRLHSPPPDIHYASILGPTPTRLQ